MSSFIPRSLLDQYHADAGAPVDRMSIFPFGTFPNPEGSGGGYHLGMAIPGMVSEPINALMQLMGTPSHPGTMWEGPDYGVASDNPQRSYLPNKDAAATLGETFFGGNALAPARMAEAKAMQELPIYFSGEKNALGNADYGAFHGPYQIGNAYTRDLGENAQVGNIKVDPDYRGQGIGTGLMNYAAKDMGKPLIPDSTFTPDGFELAKKYFGENALSNYRQTTPGGYYMQDAGGLFHGGGADALSGMTDEKASDILAALARLRSNDANSR